MADVYTSLQLSPKKKRYPSQEDDRILTPKKLRTAPPTPPPTTRPRLTSIAKPSLPPLLSRLYNIQVALQHALSHALATCAISPTSDSGIVRNVLNHISVATYSGFTTALEIEDLKRLCWLWEWDGDALPLKAAGDVDDEEENPFLTHSSPTHEQPSDWTRGSMGFVLSSSTYYSKTDRKRIPAYGIGIEVEIDINKDMGSGMAAVARWTAMSDKRRSEFLGKLQRWIELHQDTPLLPTIPLADIPDLSAPKVSALTRTLASCSPSAISSALIPGAPLSPSRSPTKKTRTDLSSILFPILPLKSPTKKKDSPLFPQTPRRNRTSIPLQTPSTKSSPVVVPSTPVHQKGSNDTLPRTPSTSRRQALLERVRQRSLSASPTKTPHKVRKLQLDETKMTRDQMLKLSQDALRHRCLLGRLGGVAESIWMLFSNPTTGGHSTPSRKRRALPWSDVINAVIKSSPVPISTAEANESIDMLIQLCPFFLKKLYVSGREWVEMPSTPTVSGSDGSLVSGQISSEVASPTRLRGKDDSANELLHRSPRRVKKEGGGLREVREIIRRELELDD